MGMVSQILMGMSVWYIPMFLGLLVVLTILKNMTSSMGRIIPFFVENKKCLRPPTSWF